MKMPYRSFNSQSRVEIIKKKFENSFSEENKTEPFRCNSATIPHRTKVLEELKDLNLDKRVQQWEGGSDCKGEGKALVKRSPAFRRDKLGCAKSFTQITCQKSLPSCHETQNAQETLSDDIKRSKTDTNLLQYCSKRAECKTDKQNDVPHPQYSVVNKSKKETVNLKFSESIRRALQSPLPKGPPPKKPPRTFCHKTSKNSNNVTPKSDIPLLKSKLEKLEKVMMIHESGSQVIKPKDCEIKKILGRNESASKTDAYASSSLCLPLCLSQSPKKLPKSKSEFYFGLNKLEFGEDSAKEFGNVTDAVSGSSKEAIYDLPIVNKKNKFETFGKSNESEIKKDEGLHYMCTDLVNQKPSLPNVSSFHWRKSYNGDSQGTKTKLTGTERQMSSSMSRIDDVKELVNELNLGNGSGRKGVNDLSGSTAFEESSGESELDSFTGVSESNCQKEAEMTTKRKMYVSRVSSKLLNHPEGLKSKSENSYSHLFECCLLVGLTLCESKQNVPYIKSIFPPHTKPPPQIEFLCFPDASYWPPTENSHPEEQYYSLVVTNENGERKFGYCRRVLPEGAHFCLPLTYCIISPHRAGGFFYKVLEELESRHGSPGLENFIKQLYELEFPGPGERLKLKEILEEATRTTPLDSGQYPLSTLVRRPPDVRLEEKDLTLLLKHLQLPVFLKVFSSLLHERKVLLLSNSLRKLSSCTEALESILRPFSWQHTFIPVLPVHLFELCEAPTPYVIGLLKSKNADKSVTDVNFEDGIFVDLDESKIVKCCGDEGSILPMRFTRDLKISLSLAMNSSSLLSESVRSVLISDAFIKFFVHVCGNYTKFITELPNGDKIFQKQEFIKFSSSNSTQSFLDWFTETAMFKTFIQERLQGEEEDMMVKLFSRRAMEYSKDTFKDSAVLLKNYKVINKKVRTLGDRIKDFTSFTK